MASLAAALQLAEAERNAALAACERAREAERAAVVQAEQLVAYRDEYERRWRERFGRGGEMAILWCYQSFVSRLGQAIEQQQQQARQLAAARERCAARLVECERRVAATGKLIERRAAAGVQAAARRERRHDDEIGARQALARRADSPPFPEMNR